MASPSVAGSSITTGERKTAMRRISSRSWSWANIARFFLKIGRHSHFLELSIRVRWYQHCTMRCIERQSLNILLVIRIFSLFAVLLALVAPNGTYIKLITCMSSARHFHQGRCPWTPQQTGNKCIKKPNEDAGFQNDQTQSIRTTVSYPTLLSILRSLQTLKIDRSSRNSFNMTETAKRKECGASSLERYSQTRTRFVQ